MNTYQTKKLLIVPTRTKGIRVFHPEQYEKAVFFAKMVKSKLKVVSVCE